MKTKPHGKFRAVFAYGISKENTCRDRRPRLSVLELREGELLPYEMVITYKPVGDDALGVPYLFYNRVNHVLNLIVSYIVHSAYPV